MIKCFFFGHKWKYISEILSFKTSGYPGTIHRNDDKTITDIRKCKNCGKREYNATPKAHYAYYCDLSGEPLSKREIRNNKIEDLLK